VTKETKPMNTRFICTSLALLALGGATATAQIQVDKNRPARPNGNVRIENQFGSVEVIGWDEKRISVTGQLPASAEGLEFSGEDDGDSEGEVRIEVEAPDHWKYETDDDTEYRASLTVHVPRGSSVEVRTINATVTLRDITGAVQVETVNGEVRLEVASRMIEVETMTGSIDIAAQGAAMDVESISGSITVRGARGSVSVESVSGSIHVQGADLEDTEIETTSGDVTFEGNLAPRGDLDVETHNGNVELILPQDVKASFECSTFEGTITNEFQASPRRSRFDPHTELSFSTSLDSEFDVSVETFSGSITLRRGNGAS